MRDVIAAELVVVEDQVPSRLLRLARMAGDATTIEERLDVPVELNVLCSFLEAQAGLVLDIPLLAGLIVLFRGQQGGVRDSIKDGISGLARRGVAEQRGLLAVGMTAAAVVADLAGPQLVPGLGHV